MLGSGEILLVACYELGHQPLAVAWPAAFLERLGYRPALMDLSVEPFNRVMVAERVRAMNPECHLCFFGLYAGLNAEYLFAHGAQSVISGEAEAPLTDLVRALEVRDGRPLPFVRRLDQDAPPHLRRLDFPVPSRTLLPSLKSYAQLERDGRQEAVGYVEASRGCL